MICTTYIFPGTGRVDYALSDLKYEKSACCFGTCGLFLYIQRYHRMDVRKRGAALIELFPRCPAAVMGTKTRRRKAKSHWEYPGKAGK